MDSRAQHGQFLVRRDAAFAAVAPLMKQAWLREQGGSRRTTLTWV